MTCAFQLVILARVQFHHEGIWTYRGVKGYGKQGKVVPHHEDLLTNCPTLVFFRAELIYLLFLLLSRKQDSQGEMTMNIYSAASLIGSL